VNFEELDIAIEELETRLERLRALYEQYFLGFEKIEPAVARKDVDRRIYVLRREKIRNTGKRFKLQTIIQRYNTFQQYWQRICREIENGTYKRHLLRAERVMGADQLLTIASRRRFGKQAADKLAAEAEVEPERPPEEIGDASPLDEIEDEGGGDTLTGLAPPPAFETERGTDKARRPTQIPGTVPPKAAPGTARPSKFESLSLDMDFLDSWNPETSVRARSQGRSPPRETSAADARRPAPSEPERPKSSPKAAPPPPPTRVAPLPRPASPAGVAPPKPASPPKAAPPPKPAKPAPPPVAAPPKSSTLSEDRIKELHEKLVRIKRENKEAGQVSMESLAKTLRATEEKLRAEHKDRRIEFEVVLRDGKAVVKPKVR
jgi:hypothetical protein